MTDERANPAATPGQEPIERMFQRAVALHIECRFTETDALCEKIIAAVPGFFRAYHLRGANAFASGDFDRGLGFIKQSLALNPHQPLAHASLAHAWMAHGRPDAAVEHYEQALRLAADLTPAGYGLGNALLALGRFAEALAAYDAVLIADPQHADAANNRGLVLVELGRLADAQSAFERVLALKPDHGLGRRNLAALLLRMGRPAQALAIWDALAQSATADCAVLVGRGNALMAMQRLPEALACHDEALRLDPRHFEARINRSSVLQRLGRIQEAIADVGLALDARPDSALALTNAGNLRLALDQNAEALISFERALAVAPCDVDACYGRGAALLALGRSEEAVEAFLAVLRARPDHPHALGHLFKWRMQRCEWTDYGSTSTALHKALSQNPRFVNPLITLLFDDPELSLRCATNFVAEYHPRDPCLGPPSPRHSGSRLRIAYVSADFSEHPVSELLIGPLERHDRSRFEILGVSLRLRGGGTFEKRVRGAFDAVVDVAGWSDQDIARWMRESGVDIAIDLMGPTVGQRLGIFACRGAPLQVAFLGHAGTVGAPYIDYLIADPTVIPAGNERWFVEAVARLPHCLLPNDDRREIGPRPERHEAGLPERGLVLCAFTQTHKINPPMFEIWMRLLGAAPDGVLWLRDPGAEAGANLRREAVARGIDARRLVFAPRLAGRAAHLGRQQLADLYLDTLPYNAHSTTCDALWSGVPVLTCMGNTMASRVAASALRAIGLPELISDSLEAYERAGVLLVTEPARLAALRARLAENRRSAPLFDTESYTRALEEAYIRMNAHASAGGEPRSFDVVGRAPG